jgi:hypothetical protein
MQGDSPDEEHIDPHGECREEIRQLQNRVVVLRAALTELLDACVEEYGPGDDDDDGTVGWSGGSGADGVADQSKEMAITFGMMRRAAAALKEQGATDGQIL